MEISAHTSNGYWVLRVEQTVGLTSDVSDIQNAIMEAFNDGNVHLAVSFCRDSFLSSRTLALLIESAEKATSIGGSFTVIAPNTQIKEVLAVFELGCTLKTVGSEEELAALAVKS
jgi:ABC-type transporter Mla MlaB component